MTEPELRGVSLPDELGAPVRVLGWTPEAGEVAVEVPADHPAYAALTRDSTRGLSSSWEAPALAALIAPDKINLPANVQVASEPAGNLEVPVSKLARVTLEVTVPEGDAATTYEALTKAAVELAKDGAPLGLLSVTVSAEDVDGTIAPDPTLTRE